MRRVLTCATVVGLAAFAMLIGPGAARADSYNLMGYEGVPTLGHVGFTLGPPPPVGDYVTTHCRYIDVINTDVGHYYLRYFLNLPDGATITQIRFKIADFNPSGVMYLQLRKRPWNSRDPGEVVRWTLSDDATNSDKTITISDINETVNNATTEYWIDMSPQNSTSPGQLCVYGIHVVYN